MKRVFIINDSSLDERCKATLLKLKSNGFDRAGVSYTTDEAVISSVELDYLLRHGAVQVNEGDVMFRGILHSYAKPNFGPEIGKIALKLNFDIL